jgi:hypothetical protein
MSRRIYRSNLNTRASIGDYWKNIKSKFGSKSSSDISSKNISNSSSLNNNEKDLINQLIITKQKSINALANELNIIRENKEHYDTTLQKCNSRRLLNNKYITSIKLKEKEIQDQIDEINELNNIINKTGECPIGLDSDSIKKYSYAQLKTKCNPMDINNITNKEIIKRINNIENSLDQSTIEIIINKIYNNEKLKDSKTLFTFAFPNTNNQLNDTNNYIAYLISELKNKPVIPPRPSALSSSALSSPEIPSRPSMSVNKELENIMINNEKSEKESEPEESILSNIQEDEPIINEEPEQKEEEPEQKEEEPNVNPDEIKLEENNMYSRYRPLRTRLNLSDSNKLKLSSFLNKGKEHLLERSKDILSKEKEHAASQLREELNKNEWGKLITQPDITNKFSKYNSLRSRIDIPQSKDQLSNVWIKLIKGKENVLNSLKEELNIIKQNAAMINKIIETECIDSSDYFKNINLTIDSKKNKIKILHEEIDNLKSILNPAAIPSYSSSADYNDLLYDDLFKNLDNSFSSYKPMKKVKSPKQTQKSRKHKKNIVKTKSPHSSSVRKTNSRNKRKVSSSRRRCNELLQNKIHINMNEFNEGRMFYSPKQAIAVAYSQVKEINPSCKKIYKKY